MKEIITSAVVATLMSLGATSANTATITLEATITGSAALLTELGIADGTAKVRVTFDNDVSSGATVVEDTNWKYDVLSSTYSAYSLITPVRTINAVASDGGGHGIFTKDGIEDRVRNTYDRFRVASSPMSPSYTPDPDSYYKFFIESFDYDQTKWSRTDPITADLLNSFSYDYFTYSRYIARTSTG
jgi:hypothetical protein